MLLAHFPKVPGQLLGGINKVFFAAVIAALVASCNDEPDIIEEPETSSWQEEANFQFELKNQYNSFANEEGMYLLGRNTITSVERQGDQLAYESAILWLNYNLNHKMPLNDRVFVTANDRVVRFAATQDPVLAHSDFYLRMEEYDPNFLGFEFPGFDFGEAMGIDDVNRVLIPYVVNDPETALTERKLLLVQLDVIHDLGSDRIDTLSTRILPSMSPVIALHEWRNEFYVTHSQGTFQVSETGDIRSISVNVPLYKMFVVDDILFGIYDTQIYASTDGLNWSPAGSGENLRLVTYQQVGDFSIGFYFSQLFLFEREGNDVEIIELSNEGLEGHKITSVSFFDDMAYVTTLSGVFKKPIDQFDIPREREEEGS